MTYRKIKSLSELEDEKFYWRKTERSEIVVEVDHTSNCCWMTACDAKILSPVGEWSGPIATPEQLQEVYEQLDIAMGMLSVFTHGFKSQEPTK